MCTHERTSMGICNGKLTRAVVPCVAACGGLHMSVLGRPLPGFAVLQIVVVWQAKKAVAGKKAAEEAEQVPCFPHWMDSISVALQATRAHALSGNIRFHSHTSVLCRTPARAIARAQVRARARARACACGGAVTDH